MHTITITHNQAFTQQEYQHICLKGVLDLLISQAVLYVTANYIAIQLNRNENL